MIIYSFIIPHKNVPSLLSRCVESIPTRDDTEIIIVDDCSSEGISELKALEKKFKNRNCTFVYQEESRGAGYARNVGISLAKGTWLLFADADDFYTDKIHGILDLYVNDIDTDIVYLNAQTYKDNGTTQPLPFDRYIRRYINKSFYSEKVLRYNMWTPWSRMVKKRMIDENNIRYEEVPIGNDKMFCLLCSKFAKKIEAEVDICYNYYMPDAGSLTYTYCIKPENLRIKLSLQLRSNNLYKEVGYFFESSLLYFYLSSASYEKTKASREVYRQFFKENSISIVGDLFRLCKQIIGKIIRII